MNREILKSLGFSDKQSKVYLGLLQLGPSSVRDLADHCNLNRGTTYDSLNWLREKNVVGFFNKKKKRHFVAKNPEKLQDITEQKKEKLQRVDMELEGLIPELQALRNSGETPVARYYEKEEIADILKDVLKTCTKEEKEYRIYSAEGVREYLYEDFPDFSDCRIEKGIKVKAISVGEGGELRGLDERKWIEEKAEVPTYIIIYPGKTAYISLDAKDKPVGVVINNKGVYQTQRLVFDQLWDRL